MSDSDSQFETTQSKQAFVDQLRATDLPANLDSESLTRQLVQCRRRQKRNRVGMTVAASMVAVLAGYLLMPQSVPNTEYFDPVPIVSNAPLSELEILESETAGNGELPIHFAALIAAKKQRVEQLKAEIQGLKESQARQQWVEKRELISRTELEQMASTLSF